LILDKGDTVKLICYNVFFDEDKPHLDYPWHHATQKLKKKKKQGTTAETVMDQPANSTIER